MTKPTNLGAALASLTKPWSPLTIATLNDYDVRVVKTTGEFPWHAHSDTDELFLVLTGHLTVRLEDSEVELGPGCLVVIPRGQRHQPYSAEGAEVLLVEPSSTVNTGDAPGELTAPRTLVAE